MSFSIAWADDARTVDLAREDMLAFQVKSGLIYNFLKYTSWPENEDDPERLQVCLLGGDPLGGALEALSGRTAQQREIFVSEIVNLGINAFECQVVFINRNQRDNLPDTLETLEGLHILTVSDIDDFSRNGGMVEFVTRKDHNIYLHINNTEIEEAGLSVEDRLLRLAEIVR